MLDRYWNRDSINGMLQPAQFSCICKCWYLHMVSVPCCSTCAIVAVVTAEVDVLKILTNKTMYNNIIYKMCLPVRETDRLIEKGSCYLHRFVPSGVSPKGSLSSFYC